MSLDLVENIDEIECSICWQNGGLLVESKCPSKHSFHSACLEAWLKNNYTCPYCSQIVNFEINTVEQFFDFLRRIRRIDKVAIKALNRFSKEMQFQCIVKNVYLFRFLTVKSKSPELCRYAVENDPYQLGFVPDNLKTPLLCRLAVAQSGYALRYVPERLKTPEMYHLAVANHGNSLEYF
ncbi:MAG: DUF4116 domain-containing protein, partial [Patescibacteria group bacterium]